jgi:hypothetical protein
MMKCKWCGKETDGDYCSEKCRVEAQGTVVISRRKQFLYNRSRNYRILVDGVEVASLENRESTTARVAPGRHKVVAKIDWCKSRPVEVEVRSGEQVQLQVGCYVRFPYVWRIILFPIYLILPGWYLFIRRV